MFWDRKSTSFIDNTMINYNQNRLLFLEPSPSSSSPSSKCTSLYLYPLNLLLGKWNEFLWRKKGKMRNFEVILTTRLQILGERRGFETGSVSLFLSLYVE
jgi:hypothetical protein